jgi:hypothetical protein
VAPSETGAAYYYNNWTGETTWEAPPGYYGYDGTYYGTYANQDAYYAEGGAGTAEAAYWQSGGGSGPSGSGHRMVG